MNPIVVAFGTALVGAMATDMWRRARASVVALWRQVHPQQAETVEEDLEILRAQVLDARQAGRADTEQALTGVWQGGYNSCCSMNLPWPPNCGRTDCAAPAWSAARWLARAAEHCWS